MRIARPVAGLFLVATLLGLAGESASIVPSDDQIDDRAAILLLAESLAKQPQTRPEALTVLNGWVGTHPDDADAMAVLARVELWHGRAHEAAGRLERLAAIHPLTPAARDTWIESLVQLGRFDEAMQISDAALPATQAPDVTRLVMAGNIRLFAGVPAQALPFYEQVLAIEPTHAAAERNLALALAYGGRIDESLPRLEKLARDNPGDNEVARALVSLSQNPAHAGRFLELSRQRVTKDPANPRLLAELAAMEAAAGHALEARRLFAQAGSLTPPEAASDLALQRARAGLGWGDFYGAETIFRDALAAAPGDDLLRGELLSLLVAMDRLEEAKADACAWLSVDPKAEPALKTLDRVAGKRQGAPVHADPSHPSLAMGSSAQKAILSADPTAVDFGQTGWSGNRSPEFVQTLTGGADGYQQRAEPLPPGVLIPQSAMQLYQWAGLYAGQGDFDLSIRCLRAARLADPAYFPAWIDLAEFLAIEGHFAEADREFAALAAAVPESRQVRLKQARALGWGRRYNESLAAYAALRALNPADPVPLLEQSRVAGWAKLRSTAARLYAVRWQAPVDARLATALRPLLHDVSLAETDMVRRWRSWANNPGTEPRPFAATARFEAEYITLAGQLPAAKDMMVRQLWLELMSDYRLQRLFWLENQAKQLAWDRRWWPAEESYVELLAHDPANQEALFDLSQVQAAQGLGQRERATLVRLMGLDANNRLAGRALFRRDRRSAPLVFARVEHYREKGRGDLSSIRRLNLAFGAELSLDDRHQLHAALLEWRDEPDTQPGATRARGFTLGAHGVFTNWLALSADFTRKIPHATSGPDPLNTGALQAWFTFRHGSRLGLGHEVREELANIFAWSRGMRSTHDWIGFEAAPTRRLEFAARANCIDYSDENSGVHLWLAPAYIWSDHPRTFKTILTLEARDTDRRNIYRFGGTGLTDIIHPYWTPQDFFSTALTLAWRHDLAADFFLGAAEHWYDVRLSLSAGNDRNRGAAWSVDYAREWQDRWVLRFGFGQTASRQWDDLRVQARLAARF
jgi:tetratricopeptide (TPR) repeat protein